jgi:phosphomevalonate kinase
MKTLKLIALLLVLLSFITASYGQSKDDQIKAIRKEFTAINKATTFKKVTLENEEFLENMTDGGGALTGLYQSGTIRKIHQWVGVSNGIEIKEYYFKNGRLIFVYEKFNSFVYDNKKAQLDQSKTETTFEGRYYFNNLRLIDYVTTGHNRFEDDAIDPEKTLLVEADDYIRLLNNKK